MTPGEDYLQKCRSLLATVEAQMPAIRQAADWFAETILAGRMVPMFACGHSRGLATPFSPGSTVGGCMIVNAIKAEVAERLTRAGHPPTVLTASAVVGAEKAKELFESAYDEHARRLAKLYENLGKQK